MGFDVKRFENLGELEDELICSICLGVFDDPYILASCGHTFCKQCIDQWFEEKRNCPNDGISVGFYRELLPAPIPLKNIIAKLKIRCDYEEKGCQQIVQVQNLSKHCEECEYRPKPPLINVPRFHAFHRVFQDVIKFLFTSRRSSDSRRERYSRHQEVDILREAPLRLFNYDFGDRFDAQRRVRLDGTTVGIVHSLPNVAIHRYVVLFGFFLVFALLLIILIGLLLLHFIDDIIPSCVLPALVVFVTLFLTAKYIENEPRDHYRPRHHHLN
ncbi:E3 ubiquitin-protein ligase NRDP1-like protein [Dinothrombium tinctorium]|uniref:E3 ubiquitin-protein ligase NRDP1-like protein n=1 Tax=Dinothrombium tinctorium TaxID=1965070 RepID=A0A3S3QXX8_9ACAR|nr:E3 ubiquitin-protein ligase NRDP1-like protein [Dinothrombium tinctorium]RWS14240.1 E3 ubiquitin-protein ligase NRDP1-like protein [Dinothrombium tinctorium]RWS15695.1 E3 ubiquitin-protein ligase NRDP1-like protein [Dinothrombium tinctorium]